MKNILTFICLSLLLMSCGDNYYVEEDLTTKRVYDIHVKATQWIPHTDANGLNLYYSYQYSIDDAGYDLSRLAAMAYINYGNYQQALPCTTHYENESKYLWTRTIDFDYSRTDIQIYVTNSDFVADPPGAMDFRVFFIW
ncbi:MAG TPA: hypothetical protein VK152_04410 [Paludibacter sp.]|nr:hypothetical protein [Paludibacter sp.]